MSVRSPGNGRGSSRGAGNGSARDSVFKGGSAGGPPLQLLIGVCLVVGLLATITAVVFSINGSRMAQTGAVSQGQQAPQALPASTTAPAAAAQPTAAAAAQPAAGIPTAPVGSALASGTGEAIGIGADGDLLLFDQESLSATAGEVYTLTFANTATAVQHNWVLVNGGDDVADAVNTAAQSQVTRQTGAAAAVPPEGTEGLLAAIPMVDAGQTSTVSFTAPAAGSYTFLCTFPGHYLAGMKGELVVN